MKILLGVLVICIITAGFAPLVPAEKGEEGRVKWVGYGVYEYDETGGATPLPDKVRRSVRDYIDRESKATRTIRVHDPVVNKDRRVSLLKLNDKVGKSGDYYYCSGVFRDIDNNEVLLLDFDVESEEGKLEVVDVLIQKIGGKRRYRYAPDGKRVPLKW